jgi:phosphohistidine phosphatase
MAAHHELYFIRHGVAENRGDEWPDDAKRPLSADGMSRMRKSARGLVNIGVVFDVVLTSPLVRTRQTAEIIAGVYELRPPIITTEALAPGAGFPAVAAELEKHARRSRIALVGHETAIGEVAARIAGSRQPFPFKKGAVCRVDVNELPPDGPGTLRWFLTPKILRNLKG